MANYKRAYVEGATYFFTVVTYQRRKIFELPKNCEILGHVIRHCQKKWPFKIDAIVLLPDHIHAIWTMPREQANFSLRWNYIKKNFTSHFLKFSHNDWDVSPSMKRKRHRGVWQKRFWEHLIRDEEDFETHFDYIHFNPVKHGLVERPGDWRHTSFHRWVSRGVYPENWAYEPAKQCESAVDTAIFGEPNT